jgi:hypothetical protein
MKLNEVTGHNSRTASILNEGYQDLNEAQILYLGKFEKELWPLVEQYTKLAEQELTKQQVLDIFSGAEQVAMDGGDNKTIAGKAGAGAAAAAKLPVDIAKKVNAKIDELGKLAKNAGPVKNADKKFKDLKLQIMDNNPDSKVVQGIVKISDWAKENPGKASLAVGILTTMAAFAGGPAGGLAAGLILRSTNELLKGADLSTAIGKSIKTAAYGALAGWALEGIGDWIEGLRVDAIPYDKAPGLTTLDVGFTKSFEVPGFSSIKDLGSMVVPEDQVGEFTNLLNAMKDATAATGSTSDPAALDAFNQLWDFTKSFDTKEFLADMNLQNEVAKAIAVTNDQFLQNLTMANSAIAAVAQGSIQGAGEKGAFKVGGDEVQPGDVTTSAAGNKKVAGVDSKATAVDPMDLKGRANIARKAAGESISMEEQYELYLAEAGFGDMIKGAAKKAAGAVGGKIKQTAKNVGNKVTADKLTKAWTKMGSPLDSGSIANILADAGMSNDQIKSIGQTSKVELEPTSGTDTAQKGADSEQPTVDTDGDGNPDAPAAKKAPAVKDAPIAKGTVINKGGKDYEWAGALWIDAATKKPLGVQASYDMGLPNPKFTAIINAAKKDPELAKLIKTQLTAKGVKPATAGAAKAATAGVKGTEKLKTA